MKVPRILVPLKEEWGAEINKEYYVLEIQNIIKKSGN